MAIDIKVEQDTLGKWHWRFLDGDIKKTTSLDTAIYMSILGEKRANANDVSQSDMRRGHFTNEFRKISDYQVGSLFWLRTSQAKLTDSQLRLIETAVTEGLNWLIEDKIVKKITVSVTKMSDGVNLDIELIGQPESQSNYYNLFVSL